MRAEQITISGKKVNAFLTGCGEPILCLSGFGGDHYNYFYLKDYLSKNYTCVLFDNRGTGLSESTSELFNLYDMAEDAHQYMLALGYTSYHVLGISMGGMVAQCLVEKYPKAIKSLGLLCTTSNHDEFLPLPESNHESLSAIYSMPAEKSSDLILKATTDLTFQEKYPDKFQEIVQLRIKHTCSLKEILKQKDAVDHFFSQKINFEHFSMPTLILTGENDRYVNPKNSQFLNKNIPHSRLKSIPKSDHYFFMEKANLVADEILSFLEKGN